MVEPHLKLAVNMIPPPRDGTRSALGGPSSDGIFEKRPFSGQGNPLELPVQGISPAERVSPVAGLALRGSSRGLVNFSLCAKSDQGHGPLGALNSAEVENHCLQELGESAHLL